MKHQLPFIKFYYLVVWILDKNYPTKADLIKLMHEKDFRVADRTFYRHLNALKDLYNIPVAFCDHNKGYFIDTENSRYYETERFLQLMQEMITANLVSSLFSENSKYLTYLQFESQPSKVFQNIFSQLLTAAEKQVQIHFQYFSYVQNKKAQYKVNPVFIKQYQNRWYLIAKHEGVYKSFALERIKNLETSNKTFTEDIDQVKKQFFQVIGLTNDAVQKVQEVHLKFHASQKNYVQSVPLHKKQQVVQDSNNQYTIKFNVKPNFELKQQILKYGALVEVLNPEALRNEIKEEYKKALKLYK